MKKIIICILILLTLTACNSASDYIEPEDRIIVSALGFENDEGQIKLTVEFINVNTTDNSDSYSISVINGIGNTTDKAVKDIEKKLDGRLMLSQCPVIIISRNLDYQKLDNLCDFIIEHDEIPLGVRLVESKNPYEIIKSNEDKKPMGYQIMGMLRFAENSFGIRDKDTFVEIINSKNSNDNIYKIPSFRLENEVAIYGCAVFKDNEFLNDFNMIDTQLLYLIEDDLSKCEIIVDDEVLKYKKSNLNQNKNIIEIKIYTDDAPIKNDLASKTENKIDNILQRLGRSQSSKVYIVGEK